MKDTTTSVVDLVEQAGVIDNQVTFDRLWSIVGDLRTKMDPLLQLTQDPSSDQFHVVLNPAGEHIGMVDGFTGPDVDWAIHSWIGQAHTGFTNIHLTVWNGAHIKTPHLGIATGTFPLPWLLLDYPMRFDLAIDVEHLDRYYEPGNERWLEVHERDDVSQFISRSLYVRQVVSHTGILFRCEAGKEQFDLIERLAHEHVDRWLGWMSDPEPTPESEREALAARDLALRKNIAVRDPANPLGDRIFGPELADQLIGNLWGRDRSSTRIGGFANVTA